jgi:membrane protease YdiL (CAAX protease family)
MKGFITRRPLTFSLLLTLALFALAFVSSIIVPETVVSNVADLPPELKLPLSDQQRGLYAIISFQTLFRMLAALLVVTLVTRLGWWREAGFNRPWRWRNLHLLWFPLLVGALTFSGGVQVSGPVFLVSVLFGAVVTAFAEESLYRGVVWRALVCMGLIRAVLTTSLLYGALYFGVSMLAGPWPEAVVLTIPATCGAFMYAALRWRTASVWPAVLVHAVFSFSGQISTPRAVPYLILLLAVGKTLGFVGYGLFLLRNAYVRADGG